MKEDLEPYLKRTITIWINAGLKFNGVLTGLTEHTATIESTSEGTNIIPLREITNIKVENGTRQARQTRESNFTTTA